jgi:hypothetical protein
MTETTIDPQDQSHNIQSGPEIVTDFLQKIRADQSLDKDTVDAIEGLYRVGKLTATNLLRNLENVRSRATHDSPEKT